jgi:BMFP domain-containing protein YqiC
MRAHAVGVKPVGRERPVSARRTCIDAHRALLALLESCEARAMTTGPNRILDEFAKLMTDAAGAAQGVRREVETAFRGQAERMLNSMDLVQREEFEAVREMALKARAENEKLSARLAELEAKLAAARTDASS